MTSAQTRIILAIALIAVLGAVNYSIYGKERIIANGEVIYLELAPVDPRSLMQGDYMALRFQLADEIAAARQAGDLSDRQRNAPLHRDERGIAKLGVLDGTSPLHIGFRVRNGEIWLGTNAYFFEEGSAHRFEGARYGEFRLDPHSADAVLVGLRGEELRAL